MNQRPAILSAPIALAITLALAAPAFATHEQVPVVRVHAEAEILAKPSTVWSHLTTGRNLVTWCPEWKSNKNENVLIQRVGDVLTYTDAWGNGGRSVVTYLAKHKELRVAHEPAKGDYMCQGKMVLTPTEKGTRVVMWDAYTDESTPDELAATADKMEKELAASLAALKKQCEGDHTILPTLHVTK
jgi:hypothetical protein